MPTLIVKRVKSKGKEYYYLVERIKEEGKQKLRKIRKLTPEEVERYKKSEEISMDFEAEKLKTVEIAEAKKVSEKPTPNEKFVLKDRDILVELKEKESGMIYLLLVTPNKVYCGYCGLTDCEHAKFVTSHKSERIDQKA